MFYVRPSLYRMACKRQLKQEASLLIIPKIVFFVVFALHFQILSSGPTKVKEHQGTDRHWELAGGEGLSWTRLGPKIHGKLWFLTPLSPSLSFFKCCRKHFKPCVLPSQVCPVPTVCHLLRLFCC